MNKNPYLEQNLTENNVDEAWHSGSGIHPMNYKSAYSRGKEWDEGPDHPAAKHFFASQKKAKSTSSDEPHSVHIGGKKWKTFGSHAHALNVAKKIKGATVVKESTNPYEQLDELKDTTLMSYAQKVSDDSMKHEKDPTKRSAAKRNKSVMGFSRALNKLEARPQKEEVELVDEAKVCKVCKKNPCVCDSNTMKEEKDYSKPIAKLKDMLGSLKRDVSTVVKGHARLEKKEKAEHEKSKMDGVKAKAQEKVDGAKAKAQEKIDKMNTDPTPEDHQAALNHFASQYRQARMTKNTDAANEHARNYHEYSKKLTGVYLKKLKAIK